MADTKGWGCGAGRFLFKDPEFHEVCEWHDKAHLHDSWHAKNMSRKETDQYFLNLMLKRAGSSLVLKAKAHLYYAIVRLVGWKYWEGER